MNTRRHIALAAAVAAITATSHIDAGVVNITQGSTSGYSLKNGNTYVVQNSVTFANSSAGGSGMTVADNATVVLYIPQGVTLTARGGNGSGQTGGGAGIRVPSTATLIITGEGSVNATGGNAGNGANGARGGNATSSSMGTGGNGGAGGGGAGAAIGGIGGNGGAINGQNGASAETMGKLYILGGISIISASGANGTAGAKGEHGNMYTAWNDSQSKAGGAGGGGGGAGSAPSCAIGGGGSSGGGGGKGGKYNQMYYRVGEGGKSKTADGEGESLGNPGGAYGAEGGAGTLYVSSTATVDVSRTKLSASTHQAAQYTIFFDVNGGSFSSSTNTATATLGCALPDCIPAPTKEGSVFAGWAADQNGTIMWYGANGVKNLSSYTNLANTTIYAIWQTSPIWYVDAGTGDDLHSGLSWDCAKKTIQSAVYCANDGDTILVKPGVYKENNSRDGSIYNVHSINATIRSIDGPYATIIDGDGVRRVVKGTAASTQDVWESHVLLLDGFTLQNGYHNGPSAAAWCNLRNCIIRNNTAARGAIVSNAHLENCLIIANVASNNLQSTEATLLDKMEMKNCTMVSNLLMSAAGCNAIAESMIVNSIIFGNNVGEGSLFADDVSASYSCLDTSMVGEGNIVADPLFVDAANGDYRLMLLSPCLNAGMSGIVDGLIDLDGNQRVRGNVIDMGCYECQDSPATPEITPANGAVFTGTTNVVISCQTDGAIIHYTTDGTEPTENSPVYRRFRVSGRTTVKAMAIFKGIESEIAVAEYATGQCADPVITPTDGADFEHSGQEVSIDWSGEDGVLRYTTDGTDPTADSPLYSSPFTIDGSTVVKARAFGDQFFDSSIVTANLTRVWVNVATPAIAAAASFTGSKTEVSLSCATEGAVIRYTLDDSVPDSTSTIYAGSFFITNSCTVKAYATCADYLDSAVASFAIEKVWGIGDTLGIPDQIFTTGGDLPFVRVTDATAPLGESMKSGAITHSQTSTLSTTVTGSGTVSFQWKTSCEDSGGEYDWDHAEFWVDGSAVAKLDGETAWQTASHDIAGDGTHTLEWRYIKDDVESEGEDCCWVADFRWISEAVSETQTTDVPVPYDWLRDYYPETPNEYDAYEAAASTYAANGVNRVWECYVAGISPTNATAQFIATITMDENGNPKVKWNPDLNENGTKNERVYTILGRVNLNEGDWTPVTDANRDEMHFFKVKVEMP